MTRVSAEDLYDGIAATKEPHHDTLYCSPDHYYNLAREASRGVMSGHRRTEDLKIAGLNVIKFDRIERPIVCEKGEVFPLAKDWKEGTVEDE